MLNTLQTQLERSTSVDKTFKDLGFDVAESFKKAVNLGRLLQAGTNITYDLKTVTGSCTLVELLRTDKIQIACATFTPNTVVPAHTHDHKQTYIVTEGELYIFVKQAKIILSVGGVQSIDAEVPHVTGSITGCEAYTIICPSDDSYSLLSKQKSGEVKDDRPEENN